MRLTVRYLLLIIMLAAGSATAAPVVDGVDLVSISRVNRTEFQYTYRLRVRGDEHSYANARFVVVSKNKATTVIEPIVFLGGLDAGSAVRPTDTFMIKQDRTVPFDLSSLDFTFYGQEVGVSANGEAVRIGRLAFVEDGGRPEHPGSFAIQDVNPAGGAQVMMLVDVFGNVTSAKYEFLDQSQGVIAEGPLILAVEQPAGGGAFAAAVITPLQPYRIRITALGTVDTENAVWQSAHVYQPKSVALKIVPAKGILAPGETASLKLQVKSASASGEYRLLLFWPTDLTGPTGPWTVILEPGQIREIPTSVTVSAGPKELGLRNLVAELVSSSDPSDVAVATLEVFLEQDPLEQLQ
jgi:hypothetical protein